VSRLAPARLLRAFPSAARSGDRGRVTAVACLGCAGLVIAYIPFLGYPWCNLDDHDYIAGNPAVLGGLTVASVRQAFRFDLWLYHPLTILSLMFDAEVARWIDPFLGPLVPGEAAAGDQTVLRAVSRLRNILLRVFNTALVGILARRLIGRGPGLAVAALFVLHPLRVEAVVWICERKELLAACLGLLAVLAYLRYAAGDGRRWYAAAVVAAAASLLSKPTFVTLPGLLLLLDVWPCRRIATSGTGSRFSFRDRAVYRCLIEKLPFLLLSLACTAATLLSIREGLVDLGRVSAWHRLQTAAIGYATYPWMAIWPWPLAILYPLKQSWDPLRVAASAAAVAGITAVAIHYRSRLPAASFGWAWYLLTTLPTSGLVQNGQQAYADRFHYVPGIGLTVALVAIVMAVTRRLRLPSNVGAAATAAAAAALLTVTVTQVRVWRDMEPLWRRAAQAVPNNWYALDQYARLLSQRGRHSEAAACWQQCHAGLAQRLGYACNLAANALAAGDAGEAAFWRASAVAEPRGRLDDCLAIAALEEKFGNHREAGFALRQALAIAPANEQVRAELQRLTLESGSSVLPPTPP
jgi:tetratricopeptide (TPR) repeat protein